MGCDIHMVVEAKADEGRWVAVNTMNVVRTHNDETGATITACPIAEDRNYKRFAALAGVRGEGPAAKGLPSDLSETARYMVDQWGGDGHSHSHMSLAKAAVIFGATGENPDGHKVPTEHYFDVHPYALTEREHRLVFWFDN